MSTINSDGSMAFGNALGGSVTIIPKNDTATNYTVTIPDVTAQVAVGRANDEAVMTALNAGGSAPIYACRAWVNFNGTGTVAIRASGNVSSITDNEVGDYTVNFTTPMPDTNYSVVGSNSNPTIWSYFGGVNLGTSSATEFAPTVSAVRLSTINSGAAKADMKFVNVAVFR